MPKKAKSSCAPSMKGDSKGKFPYHKFGKADAKAESKPAKKGKK